MDVTLLVETGVALASHDSIQFKRIQNILLVFTEFTNESPLFAQVTWTDVPYALHQNVLQWTLHLTSVHCYQVLQWVTVNIKRQVFHFGQLLVKFFSKFTRYYIFSHHDQLLAEITNFVKLWTLVVQFRFEGVNDKCRYVTSSVQDGLGIIWNGIFLEHPLVQHHRGNNVLWVEVTAETEIFARVMAVAEMFGEFLVHCHSATMTTILLLKQSLMPPKKYHKKFSLLSLPPSHEFYGLLIYLQSLGLSPKSIT